MPRCSWHYIYGCLCIFSIILLKKVGNLRYLVENYEVSAFERLIFDAILNDEDGSDEDSTTEEEDL